MDVFIWPMSFSSLFIPNTFFYIYFVSPAFQMKIFQSFLQTLPLMDIWSILQPATRGQSRCFPLCGFDVNNAYIQHVAQTKSFLVNRCFYSVSFASPFGTAACLRQAERFRSLSSQPGRLNFADMARMNGFTRLGLSGKA